MPIDYSDPLALIKAEEGFAPKAKWDYRQYSGGYGSRAAPGEVFTPAKAESYLRRDAAPVIDWVNRLVPNATPQQRAALVSFGYNLGTDDLDKLRPDIQAGDWGRVATRMRSFNRAGGEVLPGLVSRRAREAALIGGAPADPASMMAQSLRQRFGTKTEGGVMPQAQSAASGAGMDRLKSALTKSYDPDRLTDAESLTASGQRIAGTSGNALGAIGGSILAGIGGYQRNQERDARKAHDAEFSRLAGDASSTEGLMNVMLGSSDPKMREAGLELKAKLLTPKSEEWVSAGDGFVMNKTTGETRAIPGFQKTTQPTELERRALAGGLKPGTPEYESYVLGGPPKSKTEKWNEGQSKAANFGNMMTQAEGLIGNMGPKDASGKPMLGPDGQPVPAENPKGIGGVLRDALVPFEGLRNTWTPADQQTYNQAAEQWIRAKLRKESGAAIGDEEMAKEFKTYFPQYGDGPDVIRQKADARAEATRGMIAESAGAYQHFFGGEKGAAETGGDPDAPRSVRTQTIDPTTGQPRQGGSAAPAPQQTVAPPAGAVTKLLQNPTPEMQTFFDQKYGEGAAARIMEAQKTRPAAAPTPDPLQQQPNSIGAF